jgi:hypothetical protein
MLQHVVSNLFLLSVPQHHIMFSAFIFFGNLSCLVYAYFLYDTVLSYSIN